MVHKIWIDENVKLTQLDHQYELKFPKLNQNYQQLPTDCKSIPW